MSLTTFVAVAIAAAAPLPAVGHASPRFEAASRSETAATLKRDLRKLWTDHVVWTRDYIIAAALADGIIKQFPDRFGM